MAKAQDETLKPVTLAALSRAYCELEETKRRIRMKPLPKAIDVTPKARRAPAPAAFTDPTAG